jgi:catechol 2,3-dioxygenase-like lactoylglutathione lyase family enzyme
VSTQSGFVDVSPERPLFRKLDNHLLRVADLDAAISLYRDKLGHSLLWRSAEAAGFALPETDAELVVHLKIGPETDIMVARPCVGRHYVDIYGIPQGSLLSSTQVPLAACPPGGVIVILRRLRRNASAWRCRLVQGD